MDNRTTFQSTEPKKLYMNLIAKEKLKSTTSRFNPNSSMRRSQKTSVGGNTGRSGVRKVSVFDSTNQKLKDIMNFDRPSTQMSSTLDYKSHRLQTSVMHNKSLINNDDQNHNTSISSLNRETNRKYYPKPF